MSFVHDIQLMMHGFGDCRKPLSETAALIETIVHQQISSLLQQALEISEVRCSTRGISPEDILFVIRKDHLKLQRLVSYMGVRDLYQKTSAISTGAINKDFLDATNDAEGSRKKICTNFLQSIDQIGDYDSICTGNLTDPIRIERSVRYDTMAQEMSSHRYKEYCEARKASFCPRLRVNKFKEWLLTEELSDIKLTQNVLEMLNFLAYETVAQIVDLSLLVKRDAKGRYSDLTRFQPPTVLNPDYPSVLIQQQGSMLEANMDASKEMKVGMDPITPSEVREAVRRYWANNSVLAPFSKIRSAIGTTLLAG
ncbi:UNVERIFIED_CONTAM: hypothetical protein RMT77_003085 [Armadillidium vulgare]